MSEYVMVPKVPTDAMLDAGRSAVMARDCSSKTWSPRQHYEASGVSTEGIPDELLDGYHSIIPKQQGAALVYAAMLAAAPPSDDRFRKIVEEVRGISARNDLVAAVIACDAILARLDAATQETKG